jgi:hypothetical protein
MTPELKTFLVKAGVWLLGGGGALVAIWLLVGAIITAVQLKQPDRVSVPAAAAPEVKRAPTKLVTPKKPIKVFAGDTPARLKLPADVLANPAENVIAATQVRGSDRPQTVTTTINTETGESRSFVKQDPLPWLAIETRGMAQLAYGFKFQNGQATQVTRLGVGYDAVRIKALTAGVQGTVDSDGATFVGVGVAYRW